MQLGAGTRLGPYEILSSLGAGGLGEVYRAHDATLGHEVGIAQNLSLTESQAEAFWPMYEAYQAELEKINQRIAGVVQDYADAYNADAVSNAKAKELLAASIAIEETEVALRKSYAEKLDGVIPPIQAVRFLQIESKIRALIRFDLAAGIPLAY